MKTISVSLEESEIDELLKAEGTDNKSGALRLILKEWKDQKGIIAGLNRNIDGLRAELTVRRHHKSRDDLITLLICIAIVSLPMIAFVLFKLYIL